MKFGTVLAVSALGTTMCCAALANASTVMTIEQVGSDVVATANGSIDTTDLTFVESDTPSRGEKYSLLTRN